MLRTVNTEELKTKTTKEIFEILHTSVKGLEEGEARRRLLVFGVNEVAAKKGAGPVALFFSKFKNPIFIMLIVAAVISAFLGSPVDSILIVSVVVASAVIDFVNTYKSEQAVEKLRERVNVTGEVWRSGFVKEESIREFVPGDVFEIAAGDLVPADSVVIEAKDFFVNESALTGESVPVEKTSRVADRDIAMGTTVVSGRGTAVAVATGKDTKIGRIASRLEEVELPTEFDKNLRDFSVFIFRITILLVFAIIVVNLLVARNKDPLETFLFAVAIAVGLAPELLPMIVTANLAKGAIKMSQGGVIVKKLSAIHDFGSMDILCTDKTGTLTEDHIMLIKYVDGLGRDDREVLKWGYISSMHVTGIHGTLDKAIKESTKIETEGWEKVDELPFDYERKRDSVAVGRGHEVMLLTKGAPEEVFKVSTYYRDTRHRFAKDLKKKVEDEYLRLSADGFRVLALAIKKVPRKEEPYTKAEEKGMIFMGFLAFLDPPKQTVKETIEKMATYNVAVKIITGDNFLVTQKIAHELDIPVKGVLTGDEIEGMHDAEFGRKVEEANIFARVNPEQKERIIKALRLNGHVVGYLGDGVNDVLSLRAADVGISVNNAVDIAKETADIILVRKGLGEIIEGIIEGRKTFANIFKYLMMALSSNFGNMVSMPFASVFLPFLPMTASQILLNNFLYDSSQLTISFDEVEDSFLRRAKKFDLTFMKKFMILFGPLSSFFDFATFGVLFFIFQYHGATFQTGWFLESIATQTLIVNSIRSRKPFFETRPSKVILGGTLAIVGISWLLPYTAIGHLFGFVPLAPPVLIVMAVIIIAYFFAVEYAKAFFYSRWGHLIER